MTLCDTGPLVALIDRDDLHRERCVEALKVLPPRPLLVTWPCLTEAMYLLGRAGGMAAQEELWGYLADRLVVLHAPQDREWERMRELMRQYSDARMDLANASVVTAAEYLGLVRVFTLDSHFYAYRISGKLPFEIVP
jgi:predicted nucleic acid-binding protein